MARITSPLPGFNGSIGDVRFTDSVAVTDDVAVIGYCQGAGYVVEHDETVPASAYPEGAIGPEWTVKQLTAWAAEHDVDLGEATKKADILAALTPAVVVDVDGKPLTPGPDGVVALEPDKS